MYPKYSVETDTINISTAPRWVQILSEILRFSDTLIWFIFPLYEKLTGKDIINFEYKLVIYRKDSFFGKKVIVYEEIIPSNIKEHIVSKKEYHLERAVEDGTIESILQPYLRGEETIFGIDDLKK